MGYAIWYVWAIGPTPDPSRASNPIQVRNTSATLVQGHRRRTRQPQAGLFSKVRSQSLLRRNRLAAFSAMTQKSVCSVVECRHTGFFFTVCPLIRSCHGIRRTWQNGASSNGLSINSMRMRFRAFPVQTVIRRRADSQLVAAMIPAVARQSGSPPIW